MSQFKIHNLESAPKNSKETLTKVKESYGFIPNLLGICAESVETLNGYVQLSGLFQKTSLSAVERHIVLLTVSHENGCEYCLAAHSAGAARDSVPPETIKALRTGRTLKDPRQEALRQVTEQLVANRGILSAADLKEFFGAGFENKNLLEVALGVAMKTLSNYINHFAHTPLDKGFEDFKWSKGEG